VQEIVIFRTRHLETEQEIRLVLYSNGEIEAFVDDEPFESNTFEHLLASVENAKEWLELWKRETTAKTF
jgi:hypothetical protein